MSDWHKGHSSRALIPFARKGAELPYRADDGSLVVAIKSRPGVTWGSAHTRSEFHLIRDLAGAWTPHGLIVGARWMCGANSIGARLYNPEQVWEDWGEAYRKAGAETSDDAVCRKCRDVRDGVTTRPVVYRCFDKTGQRLLYIGSSKDWDKRRAQHRAQTWWWPVVQSVQLEHFDTLAEARAAEVTAIRAERPQMNRTHNRGVAS